MASSQFNRSRQQLYTTISKRLLELEDTIEELDPQAQSIHDTWRWERTLFIAVEHIEIYPESERCPFVSFLASIPDHMKELRHDVREGDILVLFYEKLTPEIITGLKQWGGKAENIHTKTTPKETPNLE